MLKGFYSEMIQFHELKILILRKSGIEDYMLSTYHYYVLAPACVYSQTGKIDSLEYFIEKKSPSLFNGRYF